MKYLNERKEMKEQFKPIKDYEGLYEISNLSRIKSLAKEWVSGKGVIRRKDETIMKQGWCREYRGIQLSKNGVTKTFAVHILVWEHFGNGKRNGMEIQVDHIDENKLNNHIDNLQLLPSRKNVVKYCKTQERSSKHIGVFWDGKGKRWRVVIYIKPKQIHLGSFIDELEASNEYQRALKEFNETGKVTINSPLMKRKTSKYKGICLWRKRKKWIAQITINGKINHIGYFNNENEAHLAYEKAKANLIKPNCHTF